jgi:hypothetical protein
MANKSLFASLKSRFVRADAVNEAGGSAYKLDAKHALTQLAATGCFNGTYYARRALFGWLTDKPVEKWAPATEADLPEEVMALAAFRKAESADSQLLILGNLSARWDLSADTAKGPAVWAAIARKMGPQALRMNLNTLVRHGVIGPDNREITDYVAARLADPDEIRRSRQFPYQFLAAYMNVGDEVPQKIKAALHKAAEIACGNVPELPGPVVIGLHRPPAVHDHAGPGAQRHPERRRLQ